MGLDLTVLPLRGHNQLTEKQIYCFDTLCFINDGLPEQIQEEIRAGNLSAQPLLPGTWAYISGENGYRRHRKDRLGGELTYVLAGQFRNYKPTVLNHRNGAVLAYLRKLSPDTPVILYWS